MENITNFFKNIPTIWKEYPTQSNANISHSNISSDLNNIEQHYYNSLYSIDITKLIITKENNVPKIIKETLNDRVISSIPATTINSNNISSSLFTYKLNINNVDCQLQIDLGTFYSNGFISKDKPISLKISIKTNIIDNFYIFKNNSLNVRYLITDDGAGVQYNKKYTTSQMYLGNKIDTSTFKNNNQSWVVSSNPNCLTIPMDGGFDSPKCIKYISSSNILQEKPTCDSFYKYTLIKNNQLWLYNNIINKEHECIESVATINENDVNSSFSNCIKIANKIIRNIDDLQINYNSTPKEVLDMFNSSDTSKWINSLMTIINRLDISKTSIHTTNMFLKRITN
jgi:hypothetical protein